MGYDIAIKEVPAQPVMSIRLVTTQAQLGDVMDQVLPEVWGYLEGKGVPPVGAPFARYHDYTPERIDLEVGLPVAQALEGAGRIQAGELPGGPVAATRHFGPYDQLGQAYDALAAWIKQQGRESSRAPWEVYLTNPAELPNSADWQTEVFWPVR